MILALRMAVKAGMIEDILERWVTDEEKESLVLIEE